MLIHFSHGTMRSISPKNSRFFVRTCDNSSLRADRLCCLSISVVFHFLRLFPLCGIALSFYDHVSALIPKVGKTYLIFDELQAVEHWEKAIESFRLNFDVDIYITSSNAYLLSLEFSTLLSGRYTEIRMLPLSFKEFLTFYSFEPSDSMEGKFQRYLQFGGMPILREYRFNEARSNQALEGIYSTVVLRDILQHNEGADQATL